jgi:putative transposase
VLIGSIKKRLEELITEVSSEYQTDILALEVMPDHVHLFISIHPDIPIQTIIKKIKGRSSRHLRKEFPELLKLPSLWTHSYFISTAGNVSSESIKKYIEAQSKL